MSLLKTKNPRIYSDVIGVCLDGRSFFPQLTISYLSSADRRNPFFRNWLRCSTPSSPIQLCDYFTTGCECCQV